MAEMKTTATPWWAVAFTVTALGGLTAAYLVLRNPTVVHHLSWHAELATALGPVTGILSLFAVVAALWSVELQRRAMAGQQHEIDRHMQLLEDQRTQFVRSADAHQALARSVAGASCGGTRAGQQDQPSLGKVPTPLGCDSASSGNRANSPRHGHCDLGLWRYGRVA